MNNIFSYIHQVEVLYVVDNSEKVNIELIEKINRIPLIKYVTVGSNKGIAYALNIAASYAITDGFTHLLTMDDDSKAPDGMVKSMNGFLSSYDTPEKVGIVSVAHSKPVSNHSYKKVSFTMASGNLLNLNAYKKVGPFDDILFIDHVDHEYNLRLSISGYEVIELSNVKLNHKLGVNKIFILFGNNLTFISHSPIRLYYLVRNGLYIASKYFLVRPLFCIRLLYLSLKEMLKALLLEDNKQKRLILIFKAFVDVSRGKMGKVDS